MGVYSVKGKGWRYHFYYRKVRYSSAYFRTKALAAKAEAEKREWLRNPPPETETTPKTAITLTFMALINKRLDHVKAYHTKRHYDDYRYMASRWARLWGKKFISEISSQEIRNFVFMRAAEASAGTGNKEITYLRATFRFGIEYGIVEKDPTRGIKFFPVDKNVKYVPPREDVWKVLIAAGPDVQDYLLALKETMARMGEINSLTWEDVDLRARTVTLYTRKKKGGHRTPRKIPMTGKLFEIFSRRYRERKKDLPWVFWHSYVSSKTRERMEGPYKDRPKIMRTLCRKAGVKYFRFHALRHFGASLLADAGVSIEPIQKLLGHENRTTTEIYLHTIGEAERRAIEVLDRDHQNCTQEGNGKEENGKEKK